MRGNENKHVKDSLTTAVNLINLTLSISGLFFLLFLKELNWLKDLQTKGQAVHVKSKLTFCQCKYTQLSS